MTKYYVYRISNKGSITFKRTKCNDYWSSDYTGCWQYSKQGAENIVKFKNDRRKNNLYCYGMIEVKKVTEMINAYDKEIDKQTYISECMSERPWWI